MKYTLFWIVVAVFVAYIQAASQSQSCVWVGGQMRCTGNTDPNGNSAVSFAGTDGQNTQIYSGSGIPPNFNPNFGGAGFPFGQFGQQFPFGQFVPQFPYGRRR